MDLIKRTENLASLLRGATLDAVLRISGAGGRWSLEQSCPASTAGRLYYPEPSDLPKNLAIKRCWAVFNLTGVTQQEDVKPLGNRVCR
mgnify:FL=1|jgi:hypothetical protein